jgi:anti-anti-sigma factor
MTVSDSAPRVTPHAIHGEYDLANAPELALRLHRICDDTRGDVELDCTHLRFWDSSAIAVLVDARQRLRATGRHIRFINLTGGPQRVLEVLGVAEMFGVDGRSRDRAS